MTTKIINNIVALRHHLDLIISRIWSEFDLVFHFGFNDFDSQSNSWECYDPVSGIQDVECFSFGLAP